MRAWERRISEDDRDEGHGWKYSKGIELGLSVFLCFPLLGYHCWLTLGVGSVAGGCPGFLGHRA